MKANVGMMHPVAAPVNVYTKGSSITYSAGSVIAEAISASVNWDRADGHFYGDDVELDSDVSILGYTIEFEPTGLPDTARALLLGETKDSTTDEYSVTDADSPDVGFGYVRVMRTTNETSGHVETTYEAWWFDKLKFAVSSEETRTKERGVEWRTPTLTGTGVGIELDATGAKHFAYHQSFATLAAAIDYIEDKANM